MDYTEGKTKTVQAIESEEIANLKLRLKYANQELELPDDYTLVIVPKYQRDSNSASVSKSTLPLNSDALSGLGRQLIQENQQTKMERH